MQNKKPSRNTGRKTPEKPTRKTTQPGLVGQIRIIGGDFRGRKLQVLNQAGLRPTGDRMRETLFNWLAFEIAGKNCLDAFAGTGSLGLEALSRGAKSVVFLEKAAPAAKQLQANLALLKLDASKAKVITCDNQAWLADLNQQPAPDFDLVFIDPPFFQGLVQPTLDLIFAGKNFSQLKWIYLEQEKDLAWPPMPAGWEIHREKTTSQSKVSLWQKSACGN